MTKMICIDGTYLQVDDTDPRALPPSPPEATITGMQLIGALTDLQASKAKLRDLLRLASRGGITVSDATLIAIATAISVTPAALFASAQGVSP